MGSALQTELRAALHAAGDPDRAVAQRAYMKSALPYAGVAMPEVRRLARRIGRSHPFGTRAELESAMRQVWDDAEVREERYAVIEVTGLPPYTAWQEPSLLPLYQHLIVTGAWWDLVDDVAIHRVAPMRRSFPDALDPVMRAWADHPDLWLRRGAVLCQVGSRDAVDLVLLGDVLAPNLGRPEAFLRKAVGWSLRTASAGNPDWVRTYVAEHRAELSPLSLREATRHLS